MSTFNYTTVDAGTFTFDLLELFPNNTLIYFNGGDGSYHQAAYILAGSATVTVHDTIDGPPIPSLTRGNDPVGTLIDLSPTKDKYTVTTTVDGLTTILFNPIPASNVLKIQVFQTPQTLNITLSDGDKYITAVVLTGTVFVNNTILSQMQWLQLPPTVTTMVTITPNSAIAIVRE